MTVGARSMVVVLLCWATLAAGVLAEEGPTFTVEAADLDLGEVKAGETAEAVFVFHNSGDEPVRILRAKPS